MLPPPYKINLIIDEAGLYQDFQLSELFRSVKDATFSDGWKLLAEIFNFRFDPKDPISPFKEMWVANGRRSMLPSDISEEILKELEESLDQIIDPEYKARIGDILWLCKKDYKAAHIAISSYIDSAKRVEDPERWTPALNRYERCLRLARQVDAKGDGLKAVLSHLEDLVFKYDDACSSYFVYKILELLCEFRFGDHNRLAKSADLIANAARQAGDFRRARSYFHVQAKLLWLAGNREGAETCRVLAAETIVEEAESREAAGSAMAAHVFWQEAICAFRDRPSLRARVPELQKRLSHVGKQTIGEMHKISHEIDVTAIVQNVKKEFRDLSIDDALLKLSVFCPLLNPSRLREEVIESASASPLKSLMEVSVYDQAGRKVGVRPALLGGDSQTDELAILGLMDEQARLHRTFAVGSAIAPAMRTILSEHVIEREDITKLIRESRFIPEDREYFYLRGIEAGLNWDFSTALHLLVPQVENSLRHVIEHLGEVPRSIENNGVEEAWSLERTLNNSKLNEALGECFIFELQSLLVNRLGPNMRNVIAHGLISHHSLQSESGLYLWWIIFRLVLTFTPSLKAFIERQRSQED
jgi:hypothetical protein